MSEAWGGSSPLPAAVGAEEQPWGHLGSHSKWPAWRGQETQARDPGGISWRKSGWPDEEGH